MQWALRKRRGKREVRRGWKGEEVRRDGEGKNKRG
jgi:hypothetical protein